LSTETKPKAPVDGVTPVQEGEQDTTKYANYGSQTANYPFTPEPDMHYVLITEMPESWGLESQFAHYERLGYKLVTKVGTRGTLAWYSIPESEYRKRKAYERSLGQITKEQARKMAKTSGPGIETWVQEDTYVKNSQLVNQPISFNR